MLFQKLRPFALAFPVVFLCGTFALAQQGNNPPNPFNNPNSGPDATTTACAGVAGCGANLVALVIVVITIASLWVLFTKAGKPGWAAIVPIYNIIVLLEIIDKPLWWIVLFLIPCANIVVGFMVAIELAKKFGKDTLYGVGMALLPFVFYPMLAFGNAQYIGHSAAPQDY